MISVFDYVKAINAKKQMPDFSGYVPFLVNKAFSYFPETIHYANEMNMWQSIPIETQFDFYINSLPKAKRFSKWYKEEKSEDLEAVSKYYNMNLIKAKEALSILKQEQIEAIKYKLKQGIENNG